MAQTVSSAQPACPKANGRPIDKAVAHFELALEGVLALQDDALALEHIWSGLRNIRQLAVKLEDQAEARIRRIRGHIAPELHRLAVEVDEGLTIATLERASQRVTARATRKAMEAQA